jgi:hypothetical protein
MLTPLQWDSHSPVPTARAYGVDCQLLETPTSGPVTIFTDVPVPLFLDTDKAIVIIDASNCVVEIDMIAPLVAAKEPEISATVVLESGKEFNLGYVAHKTVGGAGWGGYDQGT